MFTIIAFDADDTLWRNEIYYKEAEEKLSHLLSAFHPPELVGQRLFETETRNIEAYGYGIKSFTLSMIETAIELAHTNISTEEIQKIMGFGKEMIEKEVELLTGVRKTIQALSISHTLMIITKGDLLDQERKIKRSGLEKFFKYFEVVSEKTDKTYKRILDKYGIASKNFLMVGNSLKSDVLPVAEIGAIAVYIPNNTTWAHETVSPEKADQSNYYTLNSISQLSSLIKNLSKPF